MMNSSGELGFPETRWTLVARARHPEDPEAVRALEELCERYWYPVYAFARRSGCSAEDAEDATQEFFARIGQHVARADADKGRLRSFFITIIKNELSDERKRRATKKRGGHILFESFDFATAEGRFAKELVEPSANPEEFFEFVWAKEITLNSLEAVGREWEARNRRREFDRIRPLVLRLILELDGSVTRDSACAELGIQNDNLKQKIKSIRDRLYAFVAAEVRDTVAVPTDDRTSIQEVVSQEVAHIFGSLTLIEPAVAPDATIHASNG